jgi:2-keto-4-pentenoate hydratase
MIEPLLAAALHEQLARRQAALRQGAEHVGWTLGMGNRESIGGEIAVGYLTSTTLLVPGSHYRADGDGADLRADAEIVVELRADIDPRAVESDVVGGYGAALEIVDLGVLPDEPRSVVAANVFHRAVALSEVHPALPADLRAELVVGDEVRASSTAPDEPELLRRIAAAARVLDAVGVQLRAGERIITGSIVQMPVEAGDDVIAVLGDLGAIRLSISR